MKGEEKYMEKEFESIEISPNDVWALFETKRVYLVLNETLCDLRKKKINMVNKLEQARNEVAQGKPFTEISYLNASTIKFTEGRALVKNDIKSASILQSRILIYTNDSVLIFLLVEHKNLC